MKESKYNLCLQDHTGMVIYNAKADELTALNPQLAAIYEKGKDEPDTIREKHPELFACLVEKGVFVEDGTDETADYIAKREKAEDEAGEFTVTVNPTLACNMKCWYCYETHRNMPAMGTEVKRAVIALVRKQAASENIHKIILSFFGGEPLLYFDKVVADIINEAAQACEEKGVVLSIHFTTNAYLLTERILEQLKGRDVSFQITIDGNKNVHDTVRKTKSDGPTYSTIVGHIHLAASYGFPVGVRFNYTRQSLPSFIDVLSDFQNLPTSQKRLLNFTFQRVWQDHGGDAKLTEEKVAEIERAFEKADLFVNPSNSFAVPYCYADRKNTVVVNYNGDLYKCTARDFVSKNREGTLTADGDIRWNDRYRKRLSIRHGSEFCRQCRIYPICHGGCSQMKLETKAAADTCPKGYSREKIEEILKGRALFILGQYRKRNGKL